MMINSDLHQHLKAEGLGDNLIVNHLRPERFLLIKNQRLWGFTIDRVLYDLLVASLKVFLETVFIVNEEKHV